MKKLLSLLLAAVMVAAFVPVTLPAAALEATSGWGASSDGIYHITSAADLLAFGQSSSEFDGETVVLDNDIVFNDYTAAEMKAGAGDVQRYKGLGEMSKEQLWDTTLNPRTRMLTRVMMDDAIAASEMLDIFMNEGAEKRKEYIFRHAKFNKVDTFLERFGG